MVYTDYHLHTTFSHDGISTMDEHIKNAINLGLKEICSDFDQATNLLKQIDFKNYTIFENRKPKLIEL